MRAEISYDLVMEGEMDFVEGTFRLPGQDWQVLIVSKRDVAQPEVVQSTWDSGETGLCIKFPQVQPLNKATVERVLAASLVVSDWIEVRGPDSMQLR